MFISFFPFFFLLKNFIWGYSTSPTARTDNEGFQPRENYYSGARERVKSEKDQTWVEWQESNSSLNSILNTACRHSSIACVGFPDFSGILRVWRNSDGNGRGLEQRGEEQSGRFLTATLDAGGKWVARVGVVRTQVHAWTQSVLPPPRTFGISVWSIFGW